MSFIIVSTSISRFASAKRFSPIGNAFQPRFFQDAILHLIGESEPRDDEALEKNKCVKQAHIADSERKILSAIAPYLLVFGHFPESSAEGGYITPGCFYTNNGGV
ncbi:MAG: hypothetical protein IKK39_07675 [Thermoguttaceae bacterium]|nr:hypothetical protein [Thermoguttaceae bacterium]